MLMLVRESRGKSRTVADVARELSLNLKFFADGEALGQALAHKSRRIVFLTEADIEPSVLVAMSDLSGDSSLGLVMAADPEALRSSSRAKLVEKFAAFKNVAWIDKEHTVDDCATLPAAAAGACCACPKKSSSALSTRKNS